LGEWVGGFGALLLFVSLFLPWYSAGGADATAWQAMTFDDLWLAFAALLALYAFAVDATPRMAGFAVATLSLALIAALVGLFLTLYRLVDPAPEVDVSLALGAWLGLVGIIGVVVGLAKGMRDEGPARRDKALEHKAAAAARERSELLPLQGSSDSEPARGGAA
jgi:hypothetical protein